MSAVLVLIALLVQWKPIRTSRRNRAIWRPRSSRLHGSVANSSFYRRDVILRYSTRNHESGWVPSDTTCQKLSTAWFGSKFNFISSRCDSTAFCKETQKRLNIEPQGVTPLKPFIKKSDDEDAFFAKVWHTMPTQARRGGVFTRIVVHVLHDLR